MECSCTKQGEAEIKKQILEDRNEKLKNKKDASNI
jgi:hypothetical protein